jgi:hypothetical protein
MKQSIFEKINMINKLLAILTKRKREKTQISKIRDKKKDITTNKKKSNKIQRIIREYFKNLSFNKLENLKEIDTFLATYDLPKLTQENIIHLNRS